jgi:hypothetical protein
MVRVETMFEEFSLNFLGNLNFFSVSFIIGKTMIFMVGKLMMLYLMYICLSNFSVLIFELFFDIRRPWKKKNLVDFGIVD